MFKIMFLITGQQKKSILITLLINNQLKCLVSVAVNPTSTSNPVSFDLNIDPKYWPNSIWTSIPKTDAIPNTDLSRRYAVRCVFKHSQAKDYKYLIYSVLSLQKQYWDWRSPKYRPKLAICSVLCFHTLTTQWLQKLNLFGVVFQKYSELTSPDLVNNCFEIWSWIPPTMIKSLHSISALL